MNPYIKYALQCLNNANYAGYFEEINKINLPSDMEATYAQHKGIFVAGQAPYNFHQQLMSFCQTLEIRLSSNSNVVINGSGNIVTQGNNHGAVINNFGSQPAYGVDKEIEGVKKVVLLLVEQQDFLLEEYVITSNAKERFSLKKDLEKIEFELKKYRSEVLAYDSLSAKSFVAMIDKSISKTPKDTEVPSSSLRPSRQIETVFGLLEDKISSLKTEINNPISKVVVDLALGFCKEFGKTLNDNNPAFDEILELEGKLNILKNKLERTGDVSIYDDINTLAEKVVSLFNESNEVVSKESSINYKAALEELKSKLQKREKTQETKDWIEATTNALANIGKLNLASRERAENFKKFLDEFLADGTRFISGGKKLGYDFDSM